MTRKKLVLGAALVAGLLVAGIVAAASVREPSPAASQAAAAAPVEVAAAGQGRIEGRSETVMLAAELGGRVVAVADEGQSVAAGEVLARLACDDLEAELAALDAQAEVRRAQLDQLTSGGSTRERRRARAARVRASTMARAAERERKRLEQLHTAGVASDAERDAAADAETAAALDAEQARASEDLVAHPAVAAELRRARAELQVAQALAAAARIRAGRCVVRAPGAGVVLRPHVQVGDVVAPGTPVVAFADPSLLHARVEVDERDVSRVHVGQRAEVWADGATGRVAGHVTSVARLMGRKTVRSGDPADKGDRDVVEVLVVLDEPAPQFLLGLRVTARFFAAGPAAADAKSAAR